MWTTADGYTLRVSDARLRRLTPRFEGPGLRRLVGDTYELDPQRAVHLALGRLARSAFRTGALRHRRTGRLYSTFGTHAGGRAYQILARPDGPGRASIVLVLPSTDGGEYSDGHGHQVAQTALVNQLLSMGLRLQRSSGVTKSPKLIRVNRDQLGSNGQAHSDQVPDVSYVDANGRRVNVEFDTSEENRLEHMREQVRNDPNSYVIGFLVDKVTGRITGRQVYDPTRRRDQATAQLLDHPDNQTLLPGHAENPNFAMTGLPVPRRYPPTQPPPPPRVTFGRRLARIDRPPRGMLRRVPPPRQQAQGRPGQPRQQPPFSAVRPTQQRPSGGAAPRPRGPAGAGGRSTPPPRRQPRRQRESEALFEFENI